MSAILQPFMIEVRNDDVARGRVVRCTTMVGLLVQTTLPHNVCRRAGGANDLRRCWCWCWCWCWCCGGFVCLLPAGPSLEMILRIHTTPHVAWRDTWSLERSAYICIRMRTPKAARVSTL